MKSPKDAVKAKSTGRKVVSQAIAKQDKETKKGPSKTSQEIQEAIRLKAYELYVERGGVHGNDMNDWVVAEKIVLEGSR